MTKGKKLTTSTYEIIEEGGDDIGIKIILETESNSDSKDEVDKVKEKVDYLKDKINTFIKGITNKISNYPKEILTIVRKLEAKIISLNS